MREMTVSENVSFRFLTAAILLVPVMIRTWRPYRGKELGLLVLASTIGVPVQFLIHFQGLRLTTVSHASLSRRSSACTGSRRFGGGPRRAVWALEWIALVVSGLAVSRNPKHLCIWLRSRRFSDWAKLSP